MLSLSACAQDIGDADTSSDGILGPTSGTSNGDVLGPTTGTMGGIVSNGLPDEYMPDEPVEVAPLDEAFVRTRLMASLAAGTPGLAIAVVAPDGALVMGQGGTQRGMNDVTERTLFCVGSVSKPLTALAALQMAHAGRFDLDAPIQRLFPAFAPQGGGGELVTLRHLLTHTSGLGDWVTEPYDWDVLTLNEDFTRNVDQPLWFVPGTRWNYSNRGFNLVGQLIARSNRSSFAEAVRTYVFEPLGLPDAAAAAANVEAGHYALGYSEDYPEPTVPYDIGEMTQPSGGIWLSARDLEHVARALLGDAQGLDGEVLDAWRTPRVATREFPGATYAHGLFRDDSVVPGLLYHSGSFPGYTAHVMTVPSANFAVAIAQNDDGFALDPFEVATEIINHHLSYEARELALDLDYGEIPGVYNDPWHLGSFRVERSGQAWTIEFSDGDALPFEEVWPGTFYYQPPDDPWGNVLVFWPAQDGIPASLVGRAGVAHQELP